MSDETCRHCKGPMQNGICLMGCPENEPGPAITFKPRTWENTCLPMGQQVDFGDLSDKEREAYTKRYGDVVPCVS